MNIKTTLKASVAAAALVAIAAPVVSSSAQAGAIAAGGDNNSVVISGQLTRSIMLLDNGDSSEIHHVDGGNDTNSRLRILVSGQVTESVAVGGVWEANLPSSNAAGSSAIGRNTNTTAGDSGSFGFRKTAITFTHVSLGKLSIGQDSTSSDNKPSLLSTSQTNDGLTYGGKINLHDSVTKANQGTTAGSHYAGYFGGRADRVRYDTPSIMGFTASGSVMDDDAWDVGLTYGATLMSDFEIAAAIQYKEVDSATTRSNYGAGLAVKHSSGIAAGAHYGRESNRSQGTNINGLSWGAELGYTTSAMTNLGATSVSVQYLISTEANNDNFDAEKWGFYVKQNLPAGVDVFGAYEISSYEGTNTNIDDVSVALVGTQISF